MSRLLDTNMQNIIKILLLPILFIILYATNVQATSVPTLTILNWSEYMDPELIKAFEKKHNVKVQEVYFETDDTRDEMMLDAEGKGYDIVMVNGVMLEKYVKRNWIGPITAKQVPNLKYIDKKWLTSYPAANGHGVPYFWGTMGIAYRTDMVTTPVTSWRQLFEPEKAVHGKILMIKSSRDVVGAALKSLGYSMNSSNADEIEKAHALLRKQKPYVSEYSFMALTEESALVKGTIAMSMAYNGDALLVQEFHDKIAFVVPEEGTNIWVDYLTVCKHSKNKQLAYKFINYLNQPENAARQAQFVYYASPNKAATKKLPKEFLEDETIYPSKSVLEKSEFYKSLPPRATRKYNSVFSQIVN